jgi:hypothetical protein
VSTGGLSIGKEFLPQWPIALADDVPGRNTAFE